MILMGFEKGVDVLLLEMKKGEPEMINRETHFEGFRLRFIEEALID